MATLSRATPWGAFSELSFGAGLQILMVVKLRLFLVYHVCLGAGCDLGQMFWSIYKLLPRSHYSYALGLYERKSRSSENLCQ